MYALLFALGAAALIYGLVGSVTLARKVNANPSTLDKKASQSTVRHPIIANPIFWIYIIGPVFAIIVAMILIFITQG